MKIPNKLKCGGLIYDVRLDGDVAKAAQVFGQTQFSKQIVYIDGAETQQMQEETLLHEILHICLFNSGMNGRLERLERELEEDLVSAISPTLFAILKDNGLLTK